MNESGGLRSVTMRRVFDAPVELVYRAWTEAERVQRWMKCDAEATLELERWAPAVGAEFRTHMFKEGVFEAWSTGRFTEVDAPWLLAYTIDADPRLGTSAMHVRVEFAEREGGTELTLTQSGIPSDDLRGIIEAGWTNSLGMLGELVSAARAVDSAPEPAR